MNPPLAPPGCTDPTLGAWLPRWELDELSPADRQRFAEHLLLCDSCHREVYEMGPVMAELRRQQQAARLAPRGWRFSGRGLAAAALVVLFLGAGWLLSRVPGTLAPGDVESGPAPAAAWLAELEIPIPQAPAAVSGLRAPAPAAFDEAVEAYGRGDFASAAESFVVSAQLEEVDPQAWFFAGVSLLLADRPAQAEASLARAVALWSGEQRSEAELYRALALLRSGRADRGRALLEQLAAGEGVTAQRAASVWARQGGEGP